MNLELYRAYKTYKKDNKKNYMYEISIPPKKKINKEKTDTLYKKYIKDILLKEKEKLYLFEKIISNIEYDTEIKQKAEKIYSKILNDDNEMSFAESIFLIQYSTLIWIEKQKYDEQGKIKEEYKNLNKPKLFFFLSSNKPDYDGYQQNNNICFKGINYFSRKRYLEIIFHELTHYKQYYEMNNMLVTKSAINYAKCNILRKIYPNEYRNNYAYKEIEIEAEVEGYTEAVEVIEKYAKDKLETIEKLLEQKENTMLSDALSYQKDEQNNFYERYNFNIKKISDLIKNNKELLKIKEYEIFRLFYNNNGNLKNEEELLKSYKTIKMDNKNDISIFNEYFSYIYLKEKSLSNMNLPKDLLNEKYEIVYNLFNTELAKYKNISKFILEKHENTRNPFLESNDYFFIVYNMTTEKLNIYSNFLKNNKNIDIVSQIEEIENIKKNIIKKSTLKEEAFKICSSHLSLEEYEEIKKKSEQGDELCKIIVEIITENLDKMKKGYVVRIMPILEKLYKLERLNERYIDKEENNSQVIETTDNLNKDIIRRRK